MYVTPTLTIGDSLWIRWRVWLHNAAARILHNSTAARIESPATMEREFSRLLSSYGNLVSKLCLCYATSKEDLEDLKQDVWTNIWRGLHTFRNESEYSTWIYRICLNTCVSTFRRAVRRKNMMEEMLPELVLDNESTDNREEVETLYMIIASLNPIEKAMITMWLQELSYEEIASVTGLNRNTVATRIRRIKDKIAKTWHEQN